MEHFISSAFTTPSQSVPPYSEPGDVDLNKVLEQALTAAYNIIEPQRIIIRCDRLPVLQGNQPHFDKLFDHIMQLVLSEPSAGNRQFLYVRCEEEEMDKEDLPVSGHNKTYIIQFHSNIILYAYWQIAYQPILSDCEQIAKTYGGSFTYTQLNSGSLFTLRLAGKPL